MSDNRGRITRQKLLIAQILREAGRPLTAGEVYARAASVRPQLAKSTVYRNLEAMLARGEVSHGRLDGGESYYALAGEHGHRHFMICRGCSRMMDLPECPLGDLERAAGADGGLHGHGSCGAAVWLLPRLRGETPERERGGGNHRPGLI